MINVAMFKQQDKKKVVKYASLHSPETEVVDGPNILVVYRKMKSKRCKCHHCRISSVTGCCTFGRCRHEQMNHAKVMTL